VIGYFVFLTIILSQVSDSYKVPVSLLLISSVLPKYSCSLVAVVLVSRGGDFWVSASVLPF
jgi:hypothetical protein